jgi:hypothetical protein
MSIVVCKLPKAGLGNQLFPLMKAYTFGHLNNLPVLVTGYHQLKIGPYLRGEKNKRNYRGFFRFQKNILAALPDKWRVRKYRSNTIGEPVVETIAASTGADKLYVFAAMPHWDHYFDGLKEYRPLVIDLVWKLIAEKVQQEINEQPVPCIGVHIRMGDFRKLREGEDFNTVGIVRTPESYFVDIIQSIRSIHGTELPVSIFTDGYQTEFGELLQLNNVQFVEGNSDLVDLLLLSKSKIIVTSATSTFSYWAGFLSDAILLMHPAHVNTIIRPLNMADQLYQGAFDPNNSFLINSIRLIK